jgi:hypothetical protein
MQDNPEFGDLPGLLRFEEPGPPSAPHRDTRLLTIFRVGKLITDRFEELCLVRNVGVGGVMVHVNSPLIVRQRVQIELRSDRKFWGNILWIKEGTAGIAFDRQMDIEDILRRDEITSDDRRSSGPRLNIDCSAKLRVGGRYHGVRVHDLGQSGVGIALGVAFPGRLTYGQEVVVTLEGFRPVQGSTLWCGNGRAGIAFNQPIPFQELTGWLISMFGKAHVEIQGER